ncbi:MAG: hypothetical protein ABR579_05765 [Actinomycetota bacterium]
MKIIVASVVTTACLMWTAPAWAMCEPTHPSVAKDIAAANVVFVGTVTGVQDEGHSAAVHVEATWKGPSLPDQVAVTAVGGQAGGLGALQTWTVGHRYLFMPSNESSPFRDDGCSGTREYTSALDHFAPAGGIPSGSPSPGPLNRRGGAGSLFAIIVFVALAATALHQFRRTRRATQPAWHDPTSDSSKDPDLRR